jgi:hypothetical protein
MVCVLIAHALVVEKRAAKDVDIVGGADDLRAISNPARLLSNRALALFLCRSARWGVCRFVAMNGVLLQRLDGLVSMALMLMAMRRGWSWSCHIVGSWWSYATRMFEEECSWKARERNVSGGSESSKQAILR